MKLDVFNIKKEKVGAADVSDAVFHAEWRPNLVKDVLVAHEANTHYPYAHVKDRSEVRGGGKKPWRQKHTGRARHGSRRSPIWIGGGITFGPRNDKDYSKKVNKKANKAALFSVLSKKLEGGEIFIVDALSFEKGKTKNAAAFLDVFFGKGKKKSALLVRGKENTDAVRSARNIPGIEVITGDSLNVYECATHKYVVLEKEVAEKIS